MSYRTALPFFLRQQEHLVNFLADPIHYAIMATDRGRANTLRNDLSMALKAFVGSKWVSDYITIEHAQAYRINAEYVFVVTCMHSNYYVRLKVRGSSQQSTSVGVYIDGVTAHNARNLALYEAVCLCLAENVIKDPVCWTGVPTPWHRSLADKHKLEIMTDEGDVSFRLF